MTRPLPVVCHKFNMPRLVGSSGRSSQRCHNRGSCEEAHVEPQIRDTPAASTAETLAPPFINPPQAAIRASALIKSREDDGEQLQVGSLPDVSSGTRLPQAYPPCCACAAGVQMNVVA